MPVTQNAESRVPTSPTPCAPTADPKSPPKPSPCIPTATSGAVPEHPRGEGRPGRVGQRCGWWDNSHFFPPSPDYARRGQRPQPRPWRGPARLWHSTSCSAACAEVSGGGGAERRTKRPGPAGESEWEQENYRATAMDLAGGGSAFLALQGGGPTPCSTLSSLLASSDRGRGQPRWSTLAFRRLRRAA